MVIKGVALSQQLVLYRWVGVKNRVACTHSPASVRRTLGRREMSSSSTTDYFLLKCQNLGPIFRHYGTVIYPMKETSDIDNGDSAS